MRASNSRGPGGTPANTRLAASTHIPGWRAVAAERTPGKLRHAYAPGTLGSCWPVCAHHEREGAPSLITLIHPTGLALNCMSTLTPLPTSLLVLLAGPPPQELHLIVDPHHAHFGGSENPQGVT